MVDKSMTDDQLCGIVYDLVKDAEAYRDERSKERVRAMEYFDGIMNDVPAEDGRSKVVSRDVRAAIKKVVPSVVRTILGNDKIVEYEPMKEGDEEGASQATDFVNYVVFPESGGRAAVEDAIADALKLRNGIIKWWCDKRINVSYSMHSGLDDMSFDQLVSGDDIEVLEHTAREEKIETPEGPIVSPVHDVRIKRMAEERKNKLGAIPLENWLIHPDATCIEESPLCGENTRLRRSDLVAMGYAREVVDALPMASNGNLEQDEEEDTRRRDIFQRDEIQAKAMQEIEYYDLLVRVDFDNDGIAELRRIVFAGSITEKGLLENEPWDEPNYADIVAERRPHQWEGTSVTDDVAEIQKIKTVLLRETLDNLYWQNNLQPIVQEGVISNPESVTAPQFGLPIRVKNGTSVKDAVGYNIVPMVADKSFAMLEYLDNEVTDRTGISDASSGMAPDALQNMTAKASAMIEQAGIGQTEMMVRTIADGLKRVFKGLLKLTIQHQDKPRTVRLRNEWVTVDPRTWNADMDATVNTGLGAGTRERDMMMMGLIIGLQEKLLGALGPDNPYVTPDNLYNALAKQTEAAGLKSTDLYFTKPDPEDVQKRLEAMKSQPSPEQVKAQAQMQLEQMKAQLQMQMADKKMQADASKEAAQMQADLQVKMAELEKETEARRQELIINQQKEAERLAFEREKLAAEIMLKREQMDREDARAIAQRESDIQKAQAMSFGKAFERNEANEQMADA